MVIYSKNTTAKIRLIKAVDEKETLLELIKQAKSEWCKKQRENCSKIVHIIDFTKEFKEQLKFKILNAPEP